MIADGGKSTNRRMSKIWTSSLPEQANTTRPTIGATIRRTPGLIGPSRRSARHAAAWSTWKKSSVSSISGWRGWARSIVMSSVTRPGTWRHHRHTVRQERRLGDRVGDEHHRGAERFAQPAQQVAHVGAGHLVERCERLVHQQDRRVEREGPHQSDPLLHAAGQFVRIGLAEVAEPDLVQEIGHGHARRRRRRLAG